MRAIFDVVRLAYAFQLVDRVGVSVLLRLRPGAQTFALAAAEVAQLRAFRAALMQKQKGGAGGSLAISVRPDACRSAPLPSGPVLFTSWLKTAETGGYVALTRDADLRTIDGGQDIAARIPSC
jgi:hypothetical protein